MELAEPTRTVLPFDSPLGTPDMFGRRIARNTSALLMDEAHVARVADPAGGAYAVEKLTDDLAVAAWELFGRLEEGADLEVEDRRRRRAAQPPGGHPQATDQPASTEFPHLGEVLACTDHPGRESREVRR